jgi:hypothetical protein
VAHRESVQGCPGVADDVVETVRRLYERMLENLMPHVQQDMARGFTSQQDGAPPHFHREVTAYLSHTVPVWIGRGGPVTWPPRSPELTPLYFCLWGYVKDAVYVSPFQQPYTSYVHGSLIQLHKLMQTCLGGHGRKQLTGGTSTE